MTLAAITGGSMDDPIAAYARVLAIPAALALDPFALPFTAGLALKLGWLNDPLLAQPPFDLLQRWDVIMIFGGVYLLHVAADKIPPVAHLFDALGVVAKPVIGGLAAFYVARGLEGESGAPHSFAYGLGGFGAIAAFVIHGMRAKVRTTASMTTAGAAHPFISAAENVWAVIFSGLVLWAPLAAAISGLVLAVGTWLFIFLALKVTKSVTRFAGGLAGRALSATRGPV